MENPIPQTSIKEIKLMSLPEFTKKLIKEKLSKYCLNRIPEHARDKVKLNFNIDENKGTLSETRPHFPDPSKWTERPVAQFRFDNDNKKWMLYFNDRDNTWHLYERIQPSTNFDVLLKELDRVPTSIFWG